MQLLDHQKDRNYRFLIQCYLKQTGKAEQSQFADIHRKRNPS